MKNIFLLLVIMPFIASCAINGFPQIGAYSTTTCGSVKGKTTTELKYGKKRGRPFMDIKWKSFVGENTAFRIKLKPKPKLYENKEVKIIGKWGKLPNGDPTPHAWMTSSGKAKDLSDSTIVLCVPSDVPVGTEYKFDVVIDDIGDMDPRAEVTW